MTTNILSGPPAVETGPSVAPVESTAAGGLPLADDAAAWRWACCLHESGHAAYAIIECCATPAYLIATAQAGLCGNVRPASAFQAGVFAAVGSIAEKIEAPRLPPAAPAPGTRHPAPGAAGLTGDPAAPRPRRPAGDPGAAPGRTPTGTRPRRPAPRHRCRDTPPATAPPRRRRIDLTGPRHPAAATPAA
jgi:hypothetical protein